MALITCAECGREMSSEATACPACGKPNKTAQNKATDSKQQVGCAMLVLSIIVGVVFGPIAGGVVFLVGLVIVMLNTRVS